MWNIHTYYARSLGRHQSKHSGPSTVIKLGKDIQIVPMDDVEKRHKSHLAFTQSETLLWVYELITS